MIVGTAGHIDHGKTSLVRRLTGVETDRLKEEKARGISIDLGFAYWQRPGGIIGFVDVPGHEALVHNMLAGATGIDFVVLVVAADDGVMPQTREHIAILDLLGLSRGLVALTKCDLVTPDRLREATREIEAALAPTGLTGAPVLAVSAITGQGIDALTQHLDAALRESEARGRAGRFRLAVDRCFTLPGLGTTVTGTGLSGRVAVEDQVMVSPRGLEARVRSIRADNQPVSEGFAGQRCALVLAGARISKDAIHRGDVVLDPAVHRPTARIDALLRILPAERKAIGQWFPVKLHHAAAEVSSRIVLLRDKALAPGDSDFVQLVLERPIAAAAGDRFVIRDISATRTIGGGTFVDLRAPERRRGTPERRRLLQALARPDPLDAVRDALAAGSGALDLDAFIADRALAPEAGDRIIAALHLAVIETPSGRLALEGAAWSALSRALTARLDATHAEHPELPGVPLDELRRHCTPQLPMPLFQAALRHLAARGSVAIDRTWVRRPAHQARLSESDERLWRSVRPRLAAEPFRPPRVRDIAKALDVEEADVRRLMRMAARRGDVEEIAQDHYFLRETVERMATIASELSAAADDGRFTAAQFRDRLDNGRKVAIQILEFFDRHGLTLRRADLRRINPHRMRLFAPAAPPITAPQRDRDPR